ncbi:fibrinogen-like YCDxxxxGGGW domain-containing protein [Corynebacterium cystitidis]|uniref:fibrinogen-like YCDxxxxGGGW domain-containing protein n=1 Tax=Corynebacterium cystitidis TaxID=35757 RepID=UPI00211F26FC|nr:fibrinogen-like YCDxxxxGGGW domain-containing protein [Corynebacterium cystitidis]
MKLHNYVSALVLGIALTLGLAAIPSQSVALATAQENNVEAPPRDGSSPERAAASCWAIKQGNPGSPDGSYWLLSPGMEQPQEFFCDQTMDGGGWVMVGRGREGWDTYPQGQGDPAALTQRSRTPVDFKPVQLPEKTINGLLSGRAVNSLNDGFRVVRATRTSGGPWQRVDIIPDRMKEWTWALPSEDSARYRIDGSRWYRTDVLNQSFGINHGTGRIDLPMTRQRNYQGGFGFGSLVFGGNTGANNFLWTPTRRHPLPYSEVYLRPEIANDDPGFHRVPDAGTEAIEQRALVSNFAAPTDWGVTGNLTGRTAEGNSQGQAFAQIGDTIYVGGNFTAATQRSTRTNVPRTALAAFDKNTGELRHEFNVQFDNQVKALLAMPNGKLLVGGEFTTVNGQPRVGTVLLDPVTGAVDESWSLEVTSRLSNGIISVRSFALTDEHVYIGGAFTHLQDANRSWVYARSAARVSHAGTPDRDWNPEFNGSVIDIDTSADGQRFYAGGYFTESNKNTAHKAAILSTAPGAAPVDPNWRFTGSARNSNNFQQAVQETGGLLFFGGSQHSLFGYDTDTLELRSGSITKRYGGDFQAIAGNDDITYAGCHCSDNTYQGAYTWPPMNPDWQQVDNIQWFGAWDSQTGEQLGDFSPYLLRSNNAGAWSLFLDSDGALWAGGDFTGSRTSPTRAQWNGGFVKYPPRDAVAPATPQGAGIRGVTGEGVILEWSPIHDAAHYEIIRDDRVIATTTNTELTVAPGGENRFFIRAVDEAGNRSASTPLLHTEVDLDEVVDEAVLIAVGADWFYSYNAGTPQDDWAQPGADYGAWEIGAAPLGYGGTDLGTEFDVPAAAQRPITTWFAHRFEVPDPTTFAQATLSFIADDGAVVYVNGHEVNRTRMSEGPVSPTTFANAAISAARAAEERVEVEIPSYLLQPGTNTVAVESHINYRASRSLTFDAQLEVTDFGPAPQPPARPIDLVRAGDDWAMWSQSAAPADDWMSSAQLDSWQTATAPVGWGHDQLATELNPPVAQRPVVSYFVRDFEFDSTEISDPLNATVQITTRADDGAVVYLNGEEIGRKRISDGPVTHRTYANAAVNARRALEDLLVIELPVSVLREGNNRLAVSTHLNYRRTPSMSFDTNVQVVPHA